MKPLPSTGIPERIGTPPGSGGYNPNDLTRSDRMPMQVAAFSCPHCSIRLRVRDRSFLHRTISCPECGGPIEVREEDDGALLGLAAARPSRQQARPQTMVGQLSPATVAWIVAACLCLMLTAFLLFPLDRQPQSHRSGGQGHLPSVAESPSSERIRPPAAQEQTEPRLLDLYGQMTPMLERNGRFPTGTVPAEEFAAPERLSWLATIVAATDFDGPQPRWDRPWNDPANDRFVRRQQPAFLNPVLDIVVGTGRYPATHFVGVAGVGDDAATLPADHPRAGIFGHDRRVGVNDVRDGLSNTMLVAGIEEHLGSWAAGGEATVRSFTQEPYLRGPDGFGTGHADGMHVLMADGSIRFLPEETAPTIVRRLAAMNDGLPIDAAVPGEPGLPSEPQERPLAEAESVPPRHGEPTVESPAPAGSPVVDAPTMEAARVIADLARPRDRPIDVPFAEDVIAYDVNAALRQRILKFDQPDPVPLRDLLQLVEEMAAVPILLRELPPEAVPRLAQLVALSLEETTVGEILQTILKRADLSFASRPEGIVIRSQNEQPAE